MTGWRARPGYWLRSLLYVAHRFRCQFAVLTVGYALLLPCIACVAVQHAHLPTAPLWRRRLQPSAKGTLNFDHGGRKQCILPLCDTPLVGVRLPR
jgi:hypothetical protein